MRLQRYKVFLKKTNFSLIILKYFAHLKIYMYFRMFNINLRTMKGTPNHNYCIILAGGRGRRLWPSSREERPKQFLDFFGTGRTLLQQTYERFTKILPPDHIIITTNEHYGALVREQLPGIATDRLILEPVQRNTAPSVSWALHRILRIDPSGSVVITPADQIILNEAAFADCISEKLRFVADNDVLLSLGIRPTRPEPGYGYIQMGEPSGFDTIYNVKAFTEKPDREFAQMFMDSGEWLWNTGTFLANARHLRATMMHYMPAVLRQLDDINPHWTIDEENTYMQKHFRSYPNLSIDYGILEQSEHVCVACCQFGWADVGTWHGIYETKDKDAEGNVTLDTKAFFDNSHHNIVKLSKGKLAVLGALDGYIVAEEGNVLLVCKKEDSSALVRKYVNETAIRMGKEFL